jgi:hypothetical protein
MTGGSTTFRISSGSTTPPSYLSYAFEEYPPSGSFAVGYGPAGSFRGDFTPQQVSGLVQWLDFSNSKTVILDSSGQISQVSDLSGNGNHAYQSEPANRPYYITSSAQARGDTLINNLPVAHFDSTVKSYMFFKRSGQRIRPQNYCLFIVKLAVNNGGVSIPAFTGIWVNTETSAWSTGIGVSGGGSSNTLLSWADNYLTNFVSTNFQYPTNTAFFLCNCYNGTQIAQYFTGSLSGVDSFTGTIGHGTSTLSGSIGCYFGSDATPSQTFGCMSGSIGEIIFFDRMLSPSELTSVGRYLSAKWNIPSTLA